MVQGQQNSPLIDQLLGSCVPAQHCWSIKQGCGNSPAATGSDEVNTGRLILIW